MSGGFYDADRFGKPFSGLPEAEAAEKKVSSLQIRDVDSGILLNVERPLLTAAEYRELSGALDAVPDPFGFGME